MKSAEEFIANYRAERRLFLDGNITDEQRKLKWLNGDLLREVQLDAFKAGAEWAAKICFDVTTSRMIDKRNADGAFDCQKSIEIAASNLKEIPK